MGDPDRKLLRFLTGKHTDTIWAESFQTLAQVFRTADDQRRAVELERELLWRGWPRTVKVKHDPTLDQEYMSSCRDDRAAHNGQIGEIVKMSNAHGVCFLVRFVMGSPDAWYEPSELEPVQRGLTPCGELVVRQAEERRQCRDKNQGE